MLKLGVIPGEKFLSFYRGLTLYSLIDGGAGKVEGSEKSQKLISRGARIRMFWMENFRKLLKRGYP